MVPKAKQVWVRQLDAARQAQIAVVVEILGELEYLKPEAVELDPALVADCVIKNVDLNGVIRDLDEAHEPELPAAPAVPVRDEQPNDEHPVCPKCGDEMTVRTVKNGARAGANFWGCLSYPACKGTVSIEA